MKSFFSATIKILNKVISLGLNFLCLGVIIQLLINEPILGWDPVGNIQNAGSSFIGVIALVVLYLLFIDKKVE